MFSKVALNFSYAWEVSNVTEMPNDFAKLNLYHMCCISWHSSAIKLWKRDVLIVPLLETTGVFFIFWIFFNYWEFKYIKKIQVSNHQIFIYMVIVSGTTQSYILKYCISFNRAYFDNRSQKSMYHQRLVKRKNTFKIDWFV